MSNALGIFTDQLPEILSAQLTTARSTVKTDLNTIVNENDVVRATNTFLNSQSVGNSSAGTSQITAVAQVAAQTVGAGQSSGEINDDGQPIPCVIGVTNIAIPNGHKFMRDINLKDIVVTFNALTGKLDEGMVTAKMIHLVPQYQLIEFEDGHTIGVDVNGDHRFWSLDGYKPVKDLNYVMHWNNKWEVWNIVDRRIITEETVLYNMTVIGNHNYIANGIGVSNIKNRDGLENSLEI